MCLSVPARIVSIDGEYAEVSVNGALFRAGVQMIENPEVGEYILLHAGFAIQKIKEEEAREIGSLLDEIRASDPTGKAG
jgi:hydrogenase expression/formation protein HypC